MKIEEVDVARLKFDPRNVRLHDEKNISRIKASLITAGQQKPIVVGSDDIVVAGNGMLEGAIELGWTKVNIVRSELKGEDLIAYAIADNRTADLASWDYKQLSKQFKELAELDFDLTITGFADYETSMIMAANWSPKEENNTGDKDGENGEMGEGSGEPLVLGFSISQNMVFNEALGLLDEHDDIDHTDESAVHYMAQQYSEYITESEEEK